jgi:C-terminal processing protease CtpA/Prc
MGGWMKRYRFVVFISLLLAFTLLACQSQEVVETATSVPPTATVTPQALQRLGVSEVVVESIVDLSFGQEIVLVDVSALVDGKPEESSGYTISRKVESVSDVDALVFQLPLTPQGTKVDFNEEGLNDPGVQIFALKVKDALTDTAPFSGKYMNLSFPPLAGLSLQFDTENYANIQSGWMLVWAADNQQLFPVGSGDDGVLFTDDDPVQPLDLGYTAMLYEDGVVSRFRESSSRVVFSTDYAPLTFDLSGMDASGAYDEAISVLQTYYPEWDDENKTIAEDIKSAYSDEKMQFSALVAALENDLIVYEPQEGGYAWLKSLYPADFGVGININEEDEVRAYSIRLNSPADEAGLEYGDEILKVDGQPVLDAIDAVEIPFISARSEVLQQKLKTFFLFRGEDGEKMDLEIKTIKGETKTIKLEAEINSSWLLYALEDIVGFTYSPSLPVEFIDGEDFGYINVIEIVDDPSATREMFVDSLNKMKEDETDYLILDYRFVSGSQFLELAGYFIDEDMTLGSVNCLDTFSQPVVVHSAETKFDFDGIAVITGEACTGACELEVLAMQQLDNVMIFGVNDTGGAMNVGPQAKIELPDENQITFPACRFSSELLGNDLSIEPDVKLSNSFYAATYGRGMLIQESYANLLLQDKTVSDYDEKLPSITSLDVLRAYFKGIHPEMQIAGDIEVAIYYHDVNHYDLYGVFNETDGMGAFIIPFCSADLKSKVDNMKNSTLSVYLDEVQLTDFTMRISNFEDDDTFGRYKDRPCMVWAPGFMELLPGHHLMQVVLDVQEPIYYNDSYFETGKYEVDVHFLVMEEQAEEIADE